MSAPDFPALPPVPMPDLSAVQRIRAEHRDWMLRHGPQEPTEYRTATQAARQYIDAICGHHGTVVGAGYESPDPREECVRVLVLVEVYVPMAGGER